MPLSASTVVAVGGLPVILSRPLDLRAHNAPGGFIMAASAPASFSNLLEKALSEPGVISRAYHAFHGYSLGNQLLALIQCAERGIMPGPIRDVHGLEGKGPLCAQG